MNELKDVPQCLDDWEDGLTSEKFLVETKAMLRKKFDDRNSYTAEEIFDDLDKNLIAHFGEEYRNLANVRRTRRNATGLWNFQQL